MKPRRAAEERKLKFLTARNLKERAGQNARVHPPRAVLQIVQVEFQAFKHLFDAVGIAIIQRCIRRYTRA